jgi:hypothetical protein
MFFDQIDPPIFYSFSPTLPYYSTGYRALHYFKFIKFFQHNFVVFNVKENLPCLWLNLFLGDLFFLMFSKYNFIIYFISTYWILVCRNATDFCMWIFNLETLLNLLIFLTIYVFSDSFYK